MVSAARIDDPKIQTQQPAPPAPPPPPVVPPQKVEPPREEAAAEFQKFSDQSPDPKIAPAAASPQTQLPPEQRSAQFTATDDGGAIKVERAAASGAQAGFQQGAGAVFASPQAAKYERDFHQQHVAPGTEAHQRIFGDRAYAPGDVQAQSKSAARTAASDEATSYVADRQLQALDAPLDGNIDRDTKPWTHDNPLGAEVRAEAREAAIAADRARLQAVRILPGQTEDNGARVNVSDGGEGGDGITRVSWAYPDGATRTVEYKKHDPNYVRESFEAFGETRTLARDRTEKGSYTITTNNSTDGKRTYAYGDEVKRTDKNGTVQILPWGGTQHTAPDGRQSYTEPNKTMTANEQRFKAEILARYNYTPEARAWIDQNTPFLIRRPGTVDGGGFAPGGKDPQGRTTSYAFTYGEQDEAAVHELAHVWYDHKVNEKGFDLGYQATYRERVMHLANDQSADPKMRSIAQHFMRNDPTNTTEMYASLASGSMGNITKLPPYLQEYYSDLFAPPAES